MRRTLLYTNYLIPCRLSTDPEMYDLGWLWMAWMFIMRNSIGCGQCLRPKMLSDIFSFSFSLLLPNWLLISIRIYSGIARFPCDSMAFLLVCIISRLVFPVFFCFILLFHSNYGAVSLHFLDVSTSESGGNFLPLIYFRGHPRKPKDQST